MRKRYLGLGFAILALATTSCRKLPSSGPPSRLPFQPVAMGDAIPMDYGKLVGVTSGGPSGVWAQLWFETPERISVVYVDYNTGRLGPQTLVIPRR
jgi:hypothetical protein